MFNDPGLRDRGALERVVHGEAEDEREAGGQAAFHLCEIAATRWYDVTWCLAASV